MPFSDLPEALASALATHGYAGLTEVQTRVLKPDCEDRDLLVTAKTGSGKTVAFGLVIGRTLLDGQERFASPRAPRALVIAPTRELAMQVKGELDWLLGPAGGRVVACVGGMDPRREQRALEAGAHVVVGTPGRLRDHLDRGQLDLSALEVLVLDEADEMLDLGFEEELEALFDAAPAERRTVLFSATLPREIETLAARRQRNVLRIALGDAEESHSDISYSAYPIAPSDLERAIVNLLRFIDPAAALVFCATREAVKRLKANLEERGFAVVALSGELSQAERTSALAALRDKRARVCVATDVAARGLDIRDLELVIHAELPRDVQALKHRSGRTGRAGRQGACAILVPHPRRRRAEALFRAGHTDVAWAKVPSAEEIRARDTERLIEAMEPDLEVSEEDLLVARSLLTRHAPELLVAGLVKGRRSALPPPEDLIEATPAPRFENPQRERFGEAPWFAMNLGRRRNADPRWILPLICRRGGVTRADVGAIRVFEDETAFQIAPEAAEAFLERASEPTEDKVRIWARVSASEARRAQKAAPRTARIARGDDASSRNAALERPWETRAPRQPPAEPGGDLGAPAERGDAAPEAGLVTRPRRERRDTPPLAPAAGEARPRASAPRAGAGADPGSASPRRSGTAPAQEAPHAKRAWAPAAEHRRAKGPKAGFKGPKPARTKAASKTRGGAPHRRPDR